MPSPLYLFRLTLGTLGGTINRDGQDTQDDAAPSCPSCVSLFFLVVQALGARVAAGARSCLGSLYSSLNRYPPLGPILAGPLMPASPQPA